RLFSEIRPWPNPRPSSSRALRTRCVCVFGGAPTITAGRVITTPLPDAGVAGDGARFVIGDVVCTRLPGAGTRDPVAGVAARCGIGGGCARVGGTGRCEPC